MRKQGEGFTLVELMVTVSLIGILTAVAVPQYQKYSARARQTEAKAALAAIYQVEKQFYTDKSSYTQCLRQAGFAVEQANRYYSVGFAWPGDTVCGPDGTASCECWEWPAGAACTTVGSCTGTDMRFVGTAKVSNSAVIPPPGGWPLNVATSRATFTAYAAGNISVDPVTDLWSIDHEKKLINVESGL